MIAVGPHPDGATLPVRAQPGARKAAVVGHHHGALKVAVTAPPLDGRANAALIDVLAGWLGVKRSRLELLSGAAHRHKVFLVRGTSAGELGEVVRRRLGSSPHGEHSA